MYYNEVFSVHSIELLLTSKHLSLSLSLSPEQSRKESASKCYVLNFGNRWPKLLWLCPLTEEGTCVGHTPRWGWWTDWWTMPATHSKTILIYHMNSLNGNCLLQFFILIITPSSKEAVDPHSNSWIQLRGWITRNTNGIATNGANSALYTIWYAII